MGKTLVILESPGKVKAVSKYLGNEFEVLASNGHLIDLPEKEIGVDIENNFTPKYKVISNGKAAKTLKIIEAQAAKSDKVYIATDPDREGEAIGWHIANRIQSINNNIFRVTFNEITKNGVKKGIDSVGSINQNLVDSQQARRIMDRLVGYKVSPFLWKTVTGGLSAGRVQSVALKIICERDGEIESFIPEEYWTIISDFKNNGLEYEGFLHKISGKDPDISNSVDAEKVKSEIEKNSFTIQSIAKKKVKRSPQPPFITSTLLQDSVKKLGFTSKKTMQIAQQLYEGLEIGDDGFVGLITYMRTDSVRISEDANNALRNFINDKYGKDYLNKSIRVFKSKNNIQDAHEGIRPAELGYEPEKIKKFLSNDQYKLYNLIYKRFLATQFADAQFDQTTIDTVGGEYTFRTSGRVCVFEGYLKVYLDDDDNDRNSKLPEGLIENSESIVEEVILEQHFTKPPARYNEASLTKTLEEDGIGRPSTYATIIDRLITQKYIEKEEKKLVSTELGRLVNKMLIGSFPEIINEEFTKKMESELDKIEYGDEKWDKVLLDFYQPFSKSLDEALGNKSELKKQSIQQVGKKCPECKEGNLIYRWGRNGRFIACDNFPKCKYTTSLESENKEESTESTPEIVGKCEKCGSDMVVKTGRFGKFIACSNYPKCKNIKSEQSYEIPCPKEGCDGKVSQKRSKKGKVFYGCSNYPKCDYVSWDKPLEQKCPSCGNPIMMEKTRKAGVTIYCPECKTELKKEDEAQ
ncbi:MAG: type I DNA topoisomerase [Candidatus Delongbacteria bacterium]|nr:type I DNA topoisomerase [Candidatus Delongbacteria bacterium]MBN2833962.1 type I DNA topoisomerase [Candidatus Delongbacteria bacterium]